MFDSKAPTYENRRFSRVPVVKPVMISLDDGETVAAETQDLSALGMSVTSETPLPPGSVCTVRFQLEEEKQIEIKGTIVHVDGAKLGIEITAIRADTVNTLRELILANAEDPSEIDAEMISRLGFPPITY